MGRAKNLMATGKVGKLIFYEYRGIMCCRTAPGSVRQTAATKKSAAQFGLAVKASSCLRDSFYRILHDAQDKTMLYGFNSAMHKWLHEYQPNENTYSTSNFYIDNFQFNAAASMSMLVKKTVRTNFSEQGDITIDVPELIPGVDIIAPAGTAKIHYNARVAGCLFRFGKRSDVFDTPGTTEKHKTSVILEYGERPLRKQTLSLDMEPVKGALVVVAFSIQYEVKEGKSLTMVTDKSWWPVSVVGSCFGSSK
ncbi:hypothetical protein [Niastella sp. OAS944]|uniref:hypothetical protein n=1 Tax=Niastella sp. OAS944 TaxID=2664089 RepID=UPI00346AA490|nr:hypothetical protein [Chitinophagaceae bacterium OAS944]